MGNYNSVPSTVESQPEELRTLNETRANENPFYVKLTEFIDFLDKGKSEEQKSIMTCSTIIEHLIEIRKYHQEIIANPKNKIECVLYAEEEKDNTTFDFSMMGAKTSSSSSSNKPAFEEMTRNIISKVEEFKKEIIAIIRANTNTNFNINSSNLINQSALNSPHHERKRSSFKRSGSMRGSMRWTNTDLLQSVNNAFDWNAVESKKTFFEIRDRMEIIFAHYLNEMIDFSELLKKFDNPSDVDVTNTLFEGLDGLVKSFWQKNFGDEVFYVKKDTFLDSLFSQFERLKGLKSKTWVDDIDFIIDPTCDDIVSISDLKTIIKWFGPFGDMFVNMEDLLRMKCFWGSLTSIRTQELLEDQPTGTFIIRFCEDRPGDFYISCVEEEENSYSSFNNLSSKYTYHFLLQRRKGKKDDKEKYFYYLTESDLEEKKKFETIEQFIKLYNLTFKIPFEGESPLRVDLSAIIDKQDSLFDEPVLDAFIKYTGRVESEKEKKKKNIHAKGGNTSNSTSKVNKNVNTSGNNTPISVNNITITMNDNNKTTQSSDESSGSSPVVINTTTMNQNNESMLAVSVTSPTTTTTSNSTTPLISNRESRVSDLESENEIQLVEE
ncbi:hypothetical protein ABK040_009156 [Willaertia magna]